MFLFVDFPGEAAKGGYNHPNVRARPDLQCHDLEVWHYAWLALGCALVWLWLGDGCVMVVCHGEFHNKKVADVSGIC